MQLERLKKELESAKQDKIQTEIERNQHKELINNQKQLEAHNLEMVAKVNGLQGELDLVEKQKHLVA